jgi:hypothetical protein
MSCCLPVLACSPCAAALMLSGTMGAELVQLADWSGLVHGRNDSLDTLQAITPTPVPPSWSGPFRVTASDQRDYFVKSLDTCPAGQQASLAIEQIVSQAGRLIGAPVCQTSLIRIPEDLAGWSPRPGVSLRAGIAHASLALDHADFRRPPLDARTNDDNTRRQVGVYALCDWCFSADEQWLYDLDDDQAIYSHDHGLYFPPEGQGLWTRADLVAQADTSHEWRDPQNGLSAAACEEVAKALDAVERDSLIRMLCTIPASWPVSDEDLDAVGWFLEHRAPSVASRVRALA